MRTIRTIVLGLPAAMIGLSAAASAETLQGAWTKAYVSNPTIAAERARVRSVDEGVPEAKSGWRPTVILNGDVGVEYTEPSTNFGNGSSEESDSTTPVTGVATVTQPVYRGGRTIADVKRAKADVLAARASLSNVVQQVFFAVGQAYMDVLRDKAVVDLNLNNVRVLERQLQATQDRFSVGEVTRTDVAQAEARLSRSLADLKAAEGVLEQSRAAYTRQVGEPPVGLDAPSGISGLPQSLAAAVELAAQTNPIVVQAVFQHQAAEHIVRLVEGELYPTVELQGQALQSYESSSNVEETTSLSATVNVTVPLYQAGGVYARIRAAKQARSQALQQVEDARRQAIEQATRAWEQLVANRATIAALEEEIRANEIALEGVQQEALVGTRTVLDILDA